MTEQLPAAATPMSMLDKAVATGASIEVLERLMVLQERWEANQQRKAFDKAIAAAKAKIKPIFKSSKGHNTQYADLAAIASVIDPILSEHGLSYRFRARQDDRIHVACVLSHEEGHTEEGEPLAGPPDSTGSKNAIQAIGSTLTYLQRYSLMLALGLAATKDDDGNAAGGETITDDQVEELTKSITEVGADYQKFLQYMKVEALSEIHARDWGKATAAIASKRKAKA